MPKTSPSMGAHALYEPTSGSCKPSSKRDKARSRNACDRCRQKKVRCDGEGSRACSSCYELGWPCMYATKAHDEKRRYPKGYVEMVEESCIFFRDGCNKLWDILCEKDPRYTRIKTANNESKPTTEEMLSHIGMQLAGAPYKRDLASIQEWLTHHGKPFLIRHGDWDQVQHEEMKAHEVHRGSTASDSSINLEVGALYESDTTLTEAQSDVMVTQDSLIGLEGMCHAAITTSSTSDTWGHAEESVGHTDFSLSDFRQRSPDYQNMIPLQQAFFAPKTELPGSQLLENNFEFPETIFQSHFHPPMSTHPENPAANVTQVQSSPAHWYGTAYGFAPWSVG